MANIRLQQIHNHLDQYDSIADPIRVDGNGARIAVNNLDKMKAQKVMDEIKSASISAEGFAGDVLDEPFPAQLVEQVLGKMGKVNYLMNNALGTKNY
ncbi:hypothetical protein N7510_010460 [Penicillium lagena]|uniref:uncharacterized protein n=1 Tax=Penicillium lagena TaxID=94218 RepID=UPI002541E94B|nr:uncharacterized protein N7510_010460 [Penicillium lagena]KAJ5605306.1 hypothetical protein N7510_010460 [Penicillium lagena]